MLSWNTTKHEKFSAQSDRHCILLILSSWKSWSSAEQTESYKSAACVNFLKIVLARTIFPLIKRKLKIKVKRFALMMTARLVGKLLTANKAVRMTKYIVVCFVYELTSCEH
jgi:hypothetical protein